MINQFIIEAHNLLYLLGYFIVSLIEQLDVFDYANMHILEIWKVGAVPGSLVADVGAHFLFSGVGLGLLHGIDTCSQRHCRCR